ncbi:unnamed protein product [Mycena citricolor]|uniref:Uncharacterized protein n=1 Tax=Mycena citricolor TaxID=2018698 RepID=A0AAD2HGJ4_9AGAR|nr:unnamed protein product [Mycena citricolor]
MYLRLRQYEDSSQDGHLDAAWEIAVTVSLLAVFALIIGTVIWHRRRQQRWRKQLVQEEEERQQRRERRAAAREKARTPSPVLSMASTLAQPPPMPTKASVESDIGPPRYYWNHP